MYADGLQEVMIVEALDGPRGPISYWRPNKKKRKILCAGVSWDPRFPWKKPGAPKTKEKQHLK